MIPLTHIYIIIAVFVVFGGAIFLVASRWPRANKAKAAAPVEIKTEVKPEEKPALALEAISKVGEPNALVDDYTTRTTGLRNVTLLKDKDYGRQWNYLGKQVYYLKRKIDMSLEPNMLPALIKETPGELYGAFQVEQPLKNTLGPQQSAEERTRLIMIGVLCGIALFADVMILAYTPR